MKNVRNILPMAIAAVIALGVTIAARWLVPSGRLGAETNKAKSKIPMPDIPLMMKETKKIEEVSVLVVSKPIKRGAKISTDNLVWKRWPKEAVQSNFIAKDLKGNPLNNGGDYKLALTMWSGIDLAEGIPLLISMLLSYDPIKREKEEKAKIEAEKKKKEEEEARKKKEAERKNIIGAGMRAITFPIEQKCAASISMLIPGDFVDVLIPEQRDGKIKMHKYKKMKILAVDGVTTKKEENKPEQNGTFGINVSALSTAFSTPKNVTLEVKEGLVEAMLKQVGTGGLILSLRNQGDKEDKDEDTAGAGKNETSGLNVDAILNKMSSANREDSARALLENQDKRNNQQKAVERFISNMNTAASGERDLSSLKSVKKNNKDKNASNYEIVSGRIVKVNKEDENEIEEKPEETVVIHRQLSASNVVLDENGKKKTGSSGSYEKK